MENYLKEGLLKLEIDISEDTIKKLIIYAKYLKQENEKVNLTAIRDNKGIIEKHFLDSLSVLKYIKSGKAIDVGTGAGFPGMVLAIVRPDMEFTLLDSVGKKTDFLLRVIELLDIKNVKIVNKRAEDFIKEGYREFYDYGFSRAVSELNVILEYVVPFLKKDGVFLSQKVNYNPEIENAKNALKLLKVEIEDIYKFKLPYSEEDRVILKIRKLEITDEKYPRRAGIPTKRPL